MSSTTTTALKSASVYTFRLRPPLGLESVLLKELKSLNIKAKANKIPGRRIIEIQGPQELMWTLLYKSRLCEDISLRMTQPFVARGDKELRNNLLKMPWHCYLPQMKMFSEEEQKEVKFKMPQTRAKTYMSKLYHT